MLLTELLALSWLAIAQPVLSVYEQNPDELVRLRVEGLEITLFALLLTVGPALMLWALTTALSVVPRLGPLPHLLAVGALGTLTAAGLARELLGAGALLAMIVAGVLGIALVIGRMQFPAVGSALRMLAVAPGAYLLYFLLASPVTAVMETSTEALDARPVENPAPVVFLLLDEFPTRSLLDGNGAIDAELFPAFASLANDATWYRNHTTVAPFTTAAVPAILTGMMPSEPIPPPVASSHPQNLFSLLEGTYDLNVAESEITSLCRTAECRSAAQQPTFSAVGELVQSARSIWWDVIVPSDEVVDPDVGIVDQQGVASPTELMEQFTEGLRASEVPRLRFVHLLLPHQPWVFLPSGQSYNGPNPPRGQSFFVWDDALSAERGRQQHLLQLRYADALLGKFFDRLHSLDIYDQALIVVTADHGIAFDAQRPSRGASPDTVDQVMWTPLLIKAPDQKDGAVVDTPARTIDILPTIAEILGFEPDAPFDGQSLLRESIEAEEVELLQWAFNAFDLGAPDSDGYVHFDRRRWFQEMLAAPGVPPDPDGDPNLRLYRVGPHPELVGKPVADMDTAETLMFTAELTEPQSGTLRVQAGDATLPVYVEGFIQSPLELPIAVVVNGRIGLVADTRIEPGAPAGSARYFWGILPPDFFVEGDNTVELMLVDDTASGPRLYPLPTADAAGQALPPSG